MSDIEKIKPEGWLGTEVRGNISRHKELVKLHHEKVKSLRKEMLQVSTARMAWEYIVEVAAGIAPYDKGRFSAARYIVDQTIGPPRPMKDEEPTDVLMLVQIINKMLAQRPEIVEEEEENEDVNGNE